MFRISKHRSVDTKHSGSNPFDSDSDTNPYSTAKPPRTSSAPVISSHSTNPFDDDGDFGGSRSVNSKKQNHSKGGKFVAHVKDKASSVGESTVRSAERLKEAGAHRSHRLWSKSSDSKPKQVLNLQQREELFSVGEGRGASSSSLVSTNSLSSATKNRYRNGFQDSGGLESQSVQELENYAVYKSEETTESVNNCLKIAEEMREDASKTLVTLHQQGEQITRTHMVAANMDYDLSRGEKLLGSLGGIFSKTWKPKKYRSITGPVITRNDSFKRRGINLEQREKLGLQPSPKGRSNPRQYSSAPETVQEKIQLEQAKQDDALSDVSNILDELKAMAIAMGDEIEKQNGDLDPVLDDVDEIGGRIGRANLRARHLLGKQNGDLDLELDDVDEIGGRIGRANLRARHLLGKLVYIMFEERCRIPTTL